MPKLRKRNQLLPYRWAIGNRVTGLDLDTPVPFPTPRISEPWPDEFEAFLTDLQVEAEREAFRLSEY